MTDNIIQGLRFLVGYNELEAHLLSRVTVHKEKAEAYRSRIKNLHLAGEQQNDTISMDPIATMKNNAERHDDKAAHFQFMAEHLELGAKYQLSEHDLRTIEWGD